MSVADPRSQRLSELSQCAYRLGLAFGGEAERAEGAARRLEYFELFERCFFAVRMATALELRLGRPSAPGGRADREDLSIRAERDPLERDDHIESERERDREREAEPASLPVLLRTLGGVAADAAALPGPAPAALPTLRELLASIASDPAPAAGPRDGGLRTRLAGSATAPAVTVAPRASGPSGGPVVRRATGPPRR